MQDLHVHTHYSDGLASPVEVVRTAASLGLTRIAITDHDCLDAHREPEVAEAARALGIELLQGVEMDCHYRERELEILGYGFDPEDVALVARLASVQVERRDRFAFYCEGLARQGEPVVPREVLSGATRVPIKVHLYRALAAAGRTYPGGYQEYKAALAALGPAPPLDKPSLAEAVSLIRAAGGYAVLAHPLYFMRHTPAGELISAVAAAGCVGVELVYPYTFGEKGLPDAEASSGLGALRDELARAFPGGALRTQGSDVHDLTEWPARLALLRDLAAASVPRYG